MLIVCGIFKFFELRSVLVDFFVLFHGLSVEQSSFFAFLFLDDDHNHDGCYDDCSNYDENDEEDIVF